MNRAEFEERVGNIELTDEEWNIIHTVYQFHPSIPDVNGKDHIATLYKMGGFGLISDMLPTACEGERLENDLRKAREEVALAQKHVVAIVRDRDIFFKKYLPK